MKLTTKIKVVILITILLASLYLIYNPVNNKENKIIKYDVPKTESYIVTEEMVLSKLKSQAQIISMEQEFSNTYTHVDESWLGTRKTAFSLSGTYKVGLEVKDIQVKVYKDGVLCLQLPKPKLISLEIPFDQIKVNKEQGFFRGEMDDEDKQSFYKVIEKDIRSEIGSNKELMKQADLYNQEVIKGILSDLAGINYIVFQ